MKEPLREGNRGIKMARFDCLRAVAATAASVIALTSSLSIAQDFPDSDTREISAYALTESALAKFTQATKNLDALAQTTAAQCDDDDGGSATLDASVARINAVPGAQAAIQSAGMTTREYVVFTWSIFQTGMGAWALSQPGGTLPPGVSKANVDFYRAHEPALAKLSSGQSADPCSDREESDEYAEEPEPEEPTE
jgi:hypothetical protein